MGDERENMINFVQGLLDTMPLSNWKNQEIRQEYCKMYNKTSFTAEQSQILRNVVQEVAEAATSEITKVQHWKKMIKEKYEKEKEELLARSKEKNGGSDELGGKILSPFFRFL